MLSEENNKILNLKDIAVLTFNANFGIRWLAVAAAIGASSILFWLLGTIFLAIPLAFACAKLSRAYPEEGGIYAWTRRTLGERHGFVVAWLYFINNVFYYPAVLIFLAANFAYFIGKPALANNNTFVCCVVLAFFWAIIFVSIFGLKINKLLTEFGGLIGSVIPALLIISLGFFLFVSTHHSATIFNLSTLLPSEAITKSLSNLTMIMFAITGIEIIPTFANKVENPKRNLYAGLLIGTAVLVVFYIVGTIALNVILNPHEIQKTSGLMFAFHLAFSKFHLDWLTRIIAFMLVFAEVGVISMWLIAPITMFFKCTPVGLLPAWFQKTNSKQAPLNAIFFVGLIVTVILLTTNLLPAVNDMYQILVLMSALLAFIPYVYMMLAYLKESKKWDGIKMLHHFIFWSVIVSLALGIAFSFELPGDLKAIHEKVFYEAELMVGPLIFIVAGYWIYSVRQKHCAE